MNAEDAARFVRRIGAKKAVPLHWGLFDDINPAVFDCPNVVIPDFYKEINVKVMSKAEIKAAKKKPLFLKNTVDVCLINKAKNKTFTFTIYLGYEYDGASISRIFWRLVGSKENIEFKIAALIHDVLCENHHYVDNDRYFADRVFEKLLEVGDVGHFRRWLMFHSVDNFQKFCGWEK